MSQRLELAAARASMAFVAFAVALAALLGSSACGRRATPEATRRLGFDAPIPALQRRDVKLSLGDPLVQRALEQSGLDRSLPFVPAWQNMSGGPQTIEAFRAGALDGGAVGDTPPIHAAFTGLDVKIIGVQARDRPLSRLAIAPHSHVATLDDLRGKKIAYSPGQAQGALVLRVLRKAGLSRQDVHLVEILSPEFKDALASGQVDVAPLSGTTLVRYLKEFGPNGATSIAHGTVEGVSFFYVRASVLEDPDAAAALREYVGLRARALVWTYRNPERWIDAYYVKDQGLSPSDARVVFDTTGEPRFPRTWDEAIASTQETIDLLAEASGRKPFDAKTIFDRRFEQACADALASEVSTSTAAPEAKGASHP